MPRGLPKFLCPPQQHGFASEVPPNVWQFLHSGTLVWPTILWTTKIVHHLIYFFIFWYLFLYFQLFYIYIYIFYIFSCIFKYLFLFFIYIYIFTYFFYFLIFFIFTIFIYFFLNIFFICFSYIFKYYGVMLSTQVVHNFVDHPNVWQFLHSGNLVWPTIK